MLNRVLFHAGQPIAPHDLWSSWDLDPVLLVAFVALSVIVLRTRRRPPLGWIGLAIGALFLALISPLAALSGALASAHMVQHLLLVLVAAPALVTANTTLALYQALPLGWRRRLGAIRRRTGLVPARVRRLGHPLLAFLAHAGTLWFWHAAGPYQLALVSVPVHYLEHLSFFLTAIWFWHAAARSGGFGILIVFGMAMQGVFLALLMTFAQTPWYPAYETTAPLWGLSALSDLHLAGVLMWVPAGLAYTAIGLSLVLQMLEEDKTRKSKRRNRRDRETEDATRKTRDKSRESEVVRGEIRTPPRSRGTSPLG